MCPIIIGALGTIPKSLKRNLEELEADVAPGLLQKSVVLEKVYIIRREMDSFGDRMQTGENTH